MIAKNIKGKLFKVCVNYVMNESCELLEADGVWAENTKDMIRSFAMQRSGRKEIKSLSDISLYRLPSKTKQG